MQIKHCDPDYTSWKLTSFFCFFFGKYININFIYSIFKNSYSSSLLNAIFSLSLIQNDGVSRTNFKFGTRSQFTVFVYNMKILFRYFVLKRRLKFIVVLWDAKRYLIFSLKKKKKKQKWHRRLLCVFSREIVKNAPLFCQGKGKGGVGGRWQWRKRQTRQGPTPHPEREECERVCAFCWNQLLKSISLLFHTQSIYFSCVLGASYFYRHHLSCIFNNYDS